ncbi:MAG TPA: PQQ-binding-like beta-propeller repeat protein, partial [Anaerolineae bacterium]
ATGAGKWTFATTNRVVASPAVAGGAVYVQSFDRMLYALNSADGKAKWQVDTNTGKLVTPTPAAAK